MAIIHCKLKAFFRKWRCLVHNIFSERKLFQKVHSNSGEFGRVMTVNRRLTRLWEISDEWKISNGFYVHLRCKKLHQNSNENHKFLDNWDWDWTRIVVFEHVAVLCTPPCCLHLALFWLFESCLIVRCILTKKTLKFKKTCLHW